MEKNLSKPPPGSVAMTAGSILYLGLMMMLTGLRAEHWVIIALMNLLFYAGKPTRRLVLGFAIFAVFGMLYDVMRAFPNYLYNSVDIAGLYNLEKSWFGIGSGAARLTPNEWLAANHSTAGVLVSGLFYLNWVPVPLAFAAWLFYTDRKLFLDFSLTFLFVNILGFCIYYIHPAAPPWYVAQYGSDFHIGTPGSPAGLARFDTLTGIPLFHSIYGRNANVFAALPSLHCAYPVIVLYYSFRSRPAWLPWTMMVFMLGIWFAAVYSGHHYVIDAILGVLCAVAGIFLYQSVLLKTTMFRKFIKAYRHLVSPG